MDMTWCISNASGCIQLNNLVPLNILYKESHVASSSKLWMEHHQALAKLICAYNPHSVLEIGGGHGILSTLCGEKIAWTIYDPNPISVENCKAVFIQEWFNEHTKLAENYDLVVCSHVIEHIYEPDIFFQHLSIVIQADIPVVIAVPNLLKQVEYKYTNSLFFEHNWLVTEEYIKFLLNKNGFIVEYKEFFTAEHSIFFVARKNSEVSSNVSLQRLSGLYPKHKAFFLEFIQYYQKVIAQINSVLQSIKPPVYLFGAHIFAQYLLAFGLDSSKIEALLDNDPNKQGKRLYGTKLMVSSPKILTHLKEATIILKAGAYSNEIKRDIIDNINPNINFIE
jgi:2-polyprenyl-3-methyl-5-hydroxy-6-metoxy-1,4-benzoquinol methylase